MLRIMGKSEQSIANTLLYLTCKHGMRLFSRIVHQRRGRVYRSFKYEYRGSTLN
jgi:hypothetical protein